MWHMCMQYLYCISNVWIYKKKKNPSMNLCVYWDLLMWILEAEAFFLKWWSCRWTDPGPAWPLLQVLKKDSQEFVARSYWDVLRRSASQVLFSDLAEVHGPICPLSLHPSVLSVLSPALLLFSSLQLMLLLQWSSSARIRPDIIFLQCKSFEGTNLLNLHQSYSLLILMRSERLFFVNTVFKVCLL